MNILNDLQAISHKIKCGHAKRETESLLLAAQNNAIRTNHIKERIDKTQQNSRCTLRGSLNKFTDFFSYGQFY